MPLPLDQTDHADRLDNLGLATDDRLTPRREFLGQIAATAIVLAGVSCSTPAGATTTAPTPAPSPGRTQTPAAPVHWDDSWFARLTAKHKAVFDSPDIEDGLALDQATGYVRGMRDALGAGASDVQTVIVIRHAAIPMIFNDAMWAKYDIGAESKVKDGTTKKWATRNQWAGAAAAAAPSTGASDRLQPTFASLNAHGHILLGCDLATRGMAGVFARKAKLDRNAVYEELKANLVPGAILQPTGVYAAHRAQEAGCTYIRAT